MLVLTRRLDPTITLGDPLSPVDVIGITVIEVRGDQVQRADRASAASAEPPMLPKQP